VLWSLAYVVVRRLFELVLLRCRSTGSKELEILVLRHELSILRRQTRRPQLRDADRLLPAALSRALPRNANAYARALGRHAPARAPRPNPDHQPPPARARAPRLRRPLQPAPAAPITLASTARRIRLSVRPGSRRAHPQTRTAGRSHQPLRSSRVTMTKFSNPTRYLALPTRIDPQPFH
jgi:hypothetical protein